MSNLPSIQDLYSDRELAIKNDEYNTLINQPPLPEWVRLNPFANNSKYLPIERVEWLLKSIFKDYRIEITGQGHSFNGVWVTVRVHYVHPVTGQWSYHDGIGAEALQVKKGTSPADLANINNGALSMAYPKAKTQAIKDACDHFGKLFGSDLNRKDVINYTLDTKLRPLDENHPNWTKAVEAVKSGKVTIEQIEQKYTLTEESKQTLCNLSK